MRHTMTVRRDVMVEKGRLYLSTREHFPPMDYDSDRIPTDYWIQEPTRVVEAHDGTPAEVGLVVYLVEVEGQHGTHHLIEHYHTQVDCPRNLDGHETPRGRLGTVNNCWRCSHGRRTVQRDERGLYVTIEDDSTDSKGEDGDD